MSFVYIRVDVTLPLVTVTAVRVMDFLLVRLTPFYQFHRLYKNRIGDMKKKKKKKKNLFFFC